ELVLRAVGPLVGLRPSVDIHPRHVFVVERHLDLVSIASDLKMIPLADGLHGIFGRRDEIIDRSSVLHARCRRVVDRDLDCVESHILSRPRLEWPRAHENAAVTPFADFEVERELEIVPNAFMNHHISTAFVRVYTTVLNWSHAGLATARLPSLE